MKTKILITATPAAPAMSHGVAMTSAVRQLRCKGGPLPADHYDEFSMQVKLPDAAGKLYFKVTQGCDKGRAEWSELPNAAGAKRIFPTPALEVTPTASQVHQH